MSGIFFKFQPDFILESGKSHAFLRFLADLIVKSVKLRTFFKFLEVFLSWVEQKSNIFSDFYFDVGQKSGIFQILPAPAGGR